MKIISVILSVLLLVAFASTVMAVAPGKSIEYAGGGAGKVVFSGDTHKASKCNDCHVKIFQMKKNASKITMADMNAGKNCGECHNGTKAFASSDAANCGKCHKK